MNSIKYKISRKFTIELVPLARKSPKRTSGLVIRQNQCSDLVCKVTITLFTILRISIKRRHLPPEEMFLVPCIMIHKKLKLPMLNLIPRSMQTHNKLVLALMPRTLRHLRRRSSNQLSKLKPKRSFLNSKES